MHNRKSSLSSRGSMLIRLLRAVGLVPLVLAGAAWGQTLYWDGTQTNWTTLSGWSTASGAVTPDPLFAPGLINDVVFNISTVNANQTVNITTGTTVNAFSLLFNNTGTTTLQSTTTTAATLSLRAGGLTVASGAGTVTIGNTNLLTVSTQGAQTWSLAGGTTLSLGSNITRNSAVFNFTGTGTLTTSGTTALDNQVAATTTVTAFSSGASSITVASATGLIVGQTVTGAGIAAGTTISSIAGTTIGLSQNTNGSSSGNYQFGGGILGGYATIGDNWATHNASGAVTAFSNYTDTSGANQALTSAGGRNYRITNASSGTTTIASANQLNTLLVNDIAARTINLNGNSLQFAANGGVLLASGAGTLTIGAVSTTSTNPGFIAPGPGTSSGDIYFTNNSSNPIIVNAAIIQADGGSAIWGNKTANLVKAGTGTLVLNSGTFSVNAGGNNTTGWLVQAGTLKLGTSKALGTVNFGSTLGLGYQLTNNITVNPGGTLDLNGFSAAVNSVFGVAPGSSATAGKITNSVAGTSVTLTSIGFASTFNGIVENGAGTVGFTKIGTTTQTLGNANTYTGATTLGTGTFGGNLTLDFNALGSLGAAPSSIINSGSSLVLNGGSTLTINGVGGANTSHTQTFNGTTLAGGGTITPSFSNSTSGTTLLTIDLGVLSRQGNATLYLPTGSNMSATNALLKTTTGSALSLLTDANGTVYASGISNWLAKDSNNAFLGLVSNTTANFFPSGFYTNSTATTLANHANVVTAVSLTNDTTANTLRFDDTTARVVTIASGKTLTLSNGGILVGGNAVSNNRITGGTIRGTAGGALSLFGNSANANALEINSVIADNTSATALIKSGPQTIVLTGTNTYTGPTIINGGTLQLGLNTTTGTLGSAPVTINAGGTLQLQRSDTAGSLFTITNAITNNGSINQNSNGSVAFNGVISGDGTFQKSGTGIVTFNSANTYRGNTVVSNGTLTVANGGAINTGTLGGDLAVGNSGGNRGVLNINSGANVAVSKVDIGTSATSAGAIYQSGGTFSSLTASAANASFYNFNVGAGGVGSYGYYKVSGGLLAVNQFYLSSNSPGNAVAEVTGGVLSAADQIFINRSGSNFGNAALAAFNISGGIVTSTRGISTSFNEANQNTNGTLNLSGGLFGTGTSGAVTFLKSAGTNSNNRNTVNLNGGILQTSGFTIGAVTTGTGNQPLINFNGGTLKATVAGTLIPNLNVTGTVANSGVYSYSGGATIDTNNVAVTSAAPILAPTVGTGNGLTTISVTSSANGYIAAPNIFITDSTGIGASAIANMVDDGTGNGTFKIGSITVTNPGVNYSATPTVVAIANSGQSTATVTAATASGGSITNTSGSTSITNVNIGSLAVGQMVSGTGIQANTYITGLSGTTVTLSTPTSAAVTAFSTYAPALLAATTSANTSGGLTKIGLGTLTLNATQGASTYTGGTAINGGGITLDFSTGSAVTTNLINSGSALSLSGGTITLTGKASTTNGQTFASTTLNGGQNTFAANANITANPLLLALGTVARNNNATASFTLPTGTQSGTNGITVSNSNTAAGILGTWATVNGTDYATVSGGNVVAATSTTANDLSTWTTGGTTIYTNSGNFSNSVTGTVTVPAVRINTNSTTNLAITGTLKTDGILFGNSMTTALTISGGTIQTATDGGELIINNSTSGTPQPMTISSNITDNSTSSLTKAGPTRVTLTGANHYAGPTTIVGGTLRADSGTGLPTNSLLTINGGVFELNTAGTFTRTLGSSAGNVQITGGLSGFSNGGSSASTINLGSAGATLQWGSANFNPTTGLVIQAGSAVSPITLANGLDLNGAASRTIYNQGGATPTATISGVISNSVSGAVSNLTFNAGSSTIILTNTNTYDGLTNITGGTLQVGNAATTTSTGTSGTLGTGVVSVAGGTLSFNRGGDNITVTNLFTTNASGGTGTVTQAGAGTLSLAATNSSFSTLNLSAGGTIDILGNTMNLVGTLANTNAGAGNVATVNATGGGRIYLATSPTVGASAASSGVNTLVVNTVLDNFPATADVPLRSLTIGTSTTGIVVLNGANTYAGQTTIANGVAQVTSIGRLDNQPRHQRQPRRASHGAERHNQPRRRR